MENDLLRTMIHHGGGHLVLRFSHTFFKDQYRPYTPSSGRGDGEDKPRSRGKGRGKGKGKGRGKGREGSEKKDDEEAGEAEGDGDGEDKPRSRGKGRGKGKGKGRNSCFSWLSRNLCKAAMSVFS